MSQSISFDCVLLQRMKDPYRNSVMAGRGLSVKAVEQLAATSARSFDEISKASIDQYRLALGKDLWNKPSEEQTFDHAFALTLWPELTWLISADVSGRPVEIRFARKGSNPLALDHQKPKPGEWTLDDFRLASLTGELVDGWDEHQVHRFVIHGERWQAEFVFGLLQSWEPATMASDDRDGQASRAGLDPPRP